MNPNRRGLISGGGGERPAIDKEDAERGRWLSARAMRRLRFHAPRLGLDRGRLGLIGFSAGGHVAAGVVADAERARYRATDEVDRERIRPDFCGFFHPVLDMHPDLAHPGSRRALLAGPAAAWPELLARWMTAEGFAVDGPPLDGSVHGA